MAIERICAGDAISPAQINISKQAAPDMANQFEAVFLQSILKSGCIDQHFTDETSPFSGQCENKLPHELSAGIETSRLSVLPTEKKQPEISQSVDGFIMSIWPYAQQASNLIGLDPKILMAQAALETGWGQFIAKDTDGSSSHNLFNIKATHSDQSIKIKTTEYISNTPVKMTAAFKKYPSVEHSFNDYISLIKGNHRYQAALANTADPTHYINALHQAGYATDPDYANKILSIYNGDELQRVLERNGCV